MRAEAMAAKGKGVLARSGRRPRARTKPEATVNIIGAGRLGTALALALASRGYSIQAVVARRLSHARHAARLINPHPLALTISQLDKLPTADVLFITTPDDAIAPTAEHLAASTRPERHTRIALHTSGALSSDSLGSLRGAGFSVGSMHPLVSVSDPVVGAERLREAFYCVEGEPSAVRAARALVRDLGGQSFSIGARDKAVYHAAAVMASGHMVALFDIAVEMLMHCGLTPRRARDVLMPLVRSTLGNLSLREPARALTGTFARADMATVRNHLAALRQLPPGDALDAYTLLGQRSLHLARKTGADTVALKQIERALEEAGQSLQQVTGRVRRPAR